MIPVCECCGEPMRWRRRTRSPAGGQWECVVKARASHTRFNKSKKGRDRAERYEHTQIHTEIAGQKQRYTVPADQKVELQRRLSEFRAQQREELRNGRIS